MAFRLRGHTNGDEMRRKDRCVAIHFHNERRRFFCERAKPFCAPIVLVADNVSSNSYIDLPAADGFQRYVVTALRRGAEGPPSIVRVVLSDRTPPAPPTNVTLQLVANGLQINWQSGAGEAPARYNIYRNSALIRSVGGVSPILDNPPRGLMSYTVAAVELLGNEAVSAPATLELLVGAVDNLVALVNLGQATQLSWTSSDVTAAGLTPCGVQET